VAIRRDTIDAVIKRSFLDRPVPVLGQSLPMAAVLLIVVVVLGSALLAFGARMGLPILGLAPLTPLAVGQGHVWRLMTWAFFDMNGQNLVFGGLMLALFGRDLASMWGGARYLLVCLGIAGAAGMATFIVGLVWREVWVTQYLTIWPLTSCISRRGSWRSSRSCTASRTSSPTS
jgi:membrane associated rhomboid family serine protease